jgi:hypothetical protein
MNDNDDVVVLVNFLFITVDVVAVVADPSAEFDMKMLKCDSDILDRTIMNENVPDYWYWDCMSSEADDELQQSIN